MGKIAAVAVVLACSLGASGCARFGYTEVSRVRDQPDSGADSGANAGTSSDDAGGAGRPGGAGGASGSSSGTGGAGRGGAGGGGMDGGQPPLDASTDAENGDAAPDDASVDPDDAGTTDAGSSGFCPQRPDVLFCDGFEPLNFDNWSYPVVTNGTLTRSTSQRHSGEASLRATTGAAMQGNEARYATSSIPHLKSGDLWLRYYYLVPSAVTVTSHFSAGVLSEIMEPWAGFSLIIRDSTTDLTTMNGPVSGSVKFPRGKWVCVELHVRISPTDGVFEAYLDGQRVVNSTPGNTVPADGFRNAEVGIHYAEANQGPVEAYVDDVVVATGRVPCD